MLWGKDSPETDRSRVRDFPDELNREKPAIRLQSIFPLLVAWFDALRTTSNVLHCPCPLARNQGHGRDHRTPKRNRFFYVWIQHSAIAWLQCGVISFDETTQFAGVVALKCFLNVATTSNVECHRSAESAWRLIDATARLLTKLCLPLQMYTIAQLGCGTRATPEETTLADPKSLIDQLKRTVNRVRFAALCFPIPELCRVFPPHSIPRAAAAAAWTVLHSLLSAHQWATNELVRQVGVTCVLIQPMMYTFWRMVLDPVSILAKYIRAVVVPVYLYLLVAGIWNELTSNCW